VPEVERCICTIKELVHCAVLANCNFHFLPCQLVINLVQSVVFCSMCFHPTTASMTSLGPRAHCWDTD
jgi:hypothetical protein